MVDVEGRKIERGGLGQEEEDVREIYKERRGWKGRERRGKYKDERGRRCG